MSRYEALRDSDEEQEEDNHEDQQNNHNHMKDYQDNNPEKEDEEIELSIQNKELEISHTIGKNSSNLFTTSMKSQTPKYCGGMLVERVDNLVGDQPPVPSEMEIQSCLKVLQFIGSNSYFFKILCLIP